MTEKESAAPNEPSADFFVRMTVGRGGATASQKTTATFFFPFANSAAIFKAVTVLPLLGLPHTASICFCLLCIAILSILFGTPVGSTIVAVDLAAFGLFSLAGRIRRA